MAAWGIDDAVAILPIALQPCLSSKSNISSTNIPVITNNMISEWFDSVRDISSVSNLWKISSMRLRKSESFEDEPLYWSAGLDCWTTLTAEAAIVLGWPSGRFCADITLSRVDAVRLAGGGTR